jgi:lipopolysaccharide transport system ATP-binding protein
MKKESVIRLTDVFKKYRLGQMGYRTLREDIINCFKRAGKKEDYFWALKGVSFDLKRGESAGVIGDNGAGKSTILKILAGVTRQSSGTVEKKGKIGALIELSAGFHPELTGRENIYLYGAIIGLKRNYINKQFDEIVEFSGLSQFLDTPIKKYSSGMYARLGFSVTAHLDPDILLIDEVLSVGDFKFQNKCINKMHEFKERGVSIVFVSHNMDAVRKICNRTILLNKGAIVCDGSSDSVINEYYKINSNNMKAQKGGEKVIEILDIRLVKENNEQAFDFRPGEKALFKIKLRAKKNIENVSYSAFIRAASGMVIFDVNSSRLLDKRHSLAEDKTVEVCFELRLNLLKGIYKIGFNILSSSDGQLLDFIEYMNDACTFLVKESVSEQGIANLEPRVYLNI